MTHRFFFCFKNTVSDRLGTQWWAKDFKTTKEMMKFKKMIFPFIHSWAVEKTMFHYFSRPQKIPPENTKIYLVDKIRGFVT